MSRAQSAMAALGASSGAESLPLSLTQQHQAQAYCNNSLAIRQEIQRFESVHPSIYAVYDLLDLVPEPLASQIREHVVCIEGMCVCVVHGVPHHAAVVPRRPDTHKLRGRVMHEPCR